MHECDAVAGDSLQKEAGAAEDGCAGAAGDRHSDIDFIAPGGDERAARRRHGAVAFKVPYFQVAGCVGGEEGVLVLGFRFQKGESDAFAGEAAPECAAGAAG